EHRPVTPEVAGSSPVILADTETPARPGVFCCAEERVLLGVPRGRTQSGLHLLLTRDQVRPAWSRSCASMSCRWRRRKALTAYQVCGPRIAGQNKTKASRGALHAVIRACSRVIIEVQDQGLPSTWPSREASGETPMRYLVLAVDYDGTLATHGRVDEATL